MSAPDPTATLYTRTLDLARQYEGSQIELAQRAGVPFHWLRSFLAGTIRDPSVNRTQALYEFLTGKSLKV